MRPTTNRRWLVAGVLAFSFAGGCADGKPGSAAPREGGRHLLLVDGQVVEVELATTPATRAQGLMYRRGLPPGRGMLFIFPEARPLSFWMRDTLIPLDAAFADEAGRILQVERMEALDETPHVCTRPARYALEVPAGWFAEQGIKPGAVLVLSESIRRAQVE